MFSNLKTFLTPLANLATPLVNLATPLVLVAFVAGSASAIDPRLPLLEEEPGVKAKLVGFQKAWSEQKQVAAAYAQATNAPARDRIHLSLLALDDYAKAVAEFEQTGDNVEAWQKLLDGTQDLYLRAHATYFLGRSLLARDELAAAADALTRVTGRLNPGTPWTDEASFYLGYTYARLPELKTEPAAGTDARLRAHKMLKKVLANADQNQTPERVREGAQWLIRELSGEGMGPLLELAKRMETIERMIGRTKTGEGTQVRQKKVLASIDKLIAMMRKKEQQGKGDCKGGNCKKKGHKKGQCKKPGKKAGKKQGKKAGGEKNQNGAKESTLPGGGEKEAKLREAEREAAQAWGMMKDKEREKVIQFLKTNYPDRYRKLIERYYRELAKQEENNK